MSEKRNSTSSSSRRLESNNGNTHNMAKSTPQVGGGREVRRTFQMENCCHKTQNFFCGFVREDPSVVGKTE